MNYKTRELNSVEANNTLIESGANQITLGPGTYTIGTKVPFEINKGKEIFTEVKIKKIEDWSLTIPKHSLLERIKYIFTGKLKDISISKKSLGEQLWLLMSAKLDDEDVRITVAVKDIDIITRDNVTNYNVKENFPKLEGLLFEDIYEG